MFEWLNTIVESVLEFVPRVHVVRLTHATVKWTATGKARLWTHENGVWPFRAAHFWWPVLTEITNFPIERQTARGGPQYLVLRDGTKVGVEWMNVYKIDDPLAYTTKCWDAEDTLDDIMAGAVKRVVCEQECLADLVQHATDVAITRAIRSDLREFGVTTLYARLTSASSVRNIALWGMPEPAAEGE